jgi:hypothetical protein
MATATLLAIPFLAASAVHAGPVSVSQTLQFSTIQPFGTFTSTATGPASNWSPVWPFTSSSQITSVVLTFSSTDPDFNDGKLFPPDNGGGTPGVELGYIDESTSQRVGIASVTAVSPSATITAVTGSLFSGLVSSLLDSSAVFSLGAFVNYGNVASPFSTPMTLDAPSTLQVVVNGTVPDTAVPEPGTLLLAGLALAAVGVSGARRGASRQGSGSRG